MTLNDLNNLNLAGKFTGEMKSGMKVKTFKEFVEKGTEWAKEKEAEGWRYTCMGWLSPVDIKQAGIVFDNTLEEVWSQAEQKRVKQSIGFMRIPTESYYIKDSAFGTVGVKYTGPSQKFLEWYEKRKDEYQDENEKTIDKEIMIEERNESLGWRVEDIPL